MIYNHTFLCNKTARHNKTNPNRSPPPRKVNALWISGEEEHACGAPTCKKIYHTYAVFYKHCKKYHEGKFPADSLVNNRVFEGPSRPSQENRIQPQQRQRVFASRHKNLSLIPGHARYIHLVTQCSSKSPTNLKPPPCYPSRTPNFNSPKLSNSSPAT